ncbi:D-alanine/D-serine/glycine transporter [Paraburkholderia piptadeniae]|uniref:Amino acid permease n=2 Tax=Paraburkholderia TaxID=1822464 RepID=A0A7X1TII8_9BURK|nr:MULTISPECIES: amino acid permease [Paraburkholderia]MPW20426.1 amino acid permease [Paraburkholderia franconis]SIT50935.1 D-alanine/D-serine/glycine transporter [Paraburkholderia piptadeniae]
MKSEHGALHRGLGNRHIQLMSIGGAIGTGLFMGAGKTISVSGTSILLTYMVIGFFLFFTMRAMGEILLSNLQFKSFSDFCSHYIGPWAGYFIGWSYWMTWVVVAIADCTVIGGYLRFWFPDLPLWLPALVVLATLLTLNLVAVQLFGELEFWFALIKVLAITALIVAGVVMVGSGYVAPTGVRASLTHVVDPGVVFPFGASGFFAGFQIAIFSFGGIELIGTTAAETRDPGRTLPRAINAVPLRVIFFYVLSLACIISVSSWPAIAANKSPFVQLFLLAGFPAAAGVINLVVISSAMSAANSGVFATSRMLFGLAAGQHGSKYFMKLSRSSVPVRGLLFSCACMLAGLSVIHFMPEVMGAFTVLTTVSAILYIFVWGMILVAYLRYRSRDPQLHRESAFKMPGGRLMAWACLGFFAFMIYLLALEPDTAEALSVMPAWFGGLAVMYRWRKVKKSRPQTIKVLN